MFKGFKDFLSRGNIVDLAVAVVIGTAFTALVTKFTQSVIEPLIQRIGAGPNSKHGFLHFEIGGGQAIDLNILLSATINFVLVAAVVYFLVVVPHKKLQQLSEGEQDAESEKITEVALLTEIRNILAESSDGTSEKHRAPPGATEAETTS
ncbi:MAG: large-conductance mechanosensitive channel protein MscL [Mycobacterium sp.]